MRRITDFLNECDRCELEQPTYNGFQDEENYSLYIKKLYEGAVSALLERNGETMMSAIRTRYAEVEVGMEHADFPSPETLVRMKEDYKITHTASLRKECDYLGMARRCRDMQLYFFSEFSKYIQVDSCDGHDQETYEETSVGEESPKVDTHDEDLIRGIRELAKFLRCGVNKANAIVKNGVLKEVGVQFKIGNTNCFNKKKLEEVLSSNPDIFKKVHWH